MKLLADLHIWIGLCAGGSYLYSSEITPGIDFNWITFLLICSSTTALYSFLKLLKKTSLLQVLVFTISSLTAISSLILSEPDMSYIILIPSVLLGVGYGRLPFLKKNLRAVPYLKVFIISFVWVWVTLIFPLYTSDGSFDRSLLIFTLSQILFLLAVTIPFDIRDLKYDTTSLKTIPQVLGVDFSKILCGIFLLISTCLGLYYLHLVSLTNYSSALLITSVLTGILLLKVKENRSTYFFSIQIDGLLLVQGVLVMLFR